VYPVFIRDPFSRTDTVEPAMYGEEPSVGAVPPV